MSVWIVKRGSIERQIPDTPTLVRLARENRLLATDLVFDTPSQQWVAASELRELKYVFDGFSSNKNTVPDEAADPTSGIPTESDAVVPPSDAMTSTSVNKGWGATSLILGLVGGAVATFGGITLLSLKAAGENSMIEAIAHGIGIYCIGKGLFMIAAVANARAAVDFIVNQVRR